MSYAVYATHQDVTGYDGSVAQYVRAVAQTRGVVAPEVVAALELAYRYRVNRALAGTGMVLIGDRIIGPNNPSASEVRAQVALEERSGEDSPAAAAIAQATPTQGELAVALARQSPVLSVVPVHERRMV